MMHPARTLLFSFFAITPLLLTGCGGGNDAVIAAGNAPNSFTPKDAGDNSEHGENATTEQNACQGNATKTQFTYCVTVEGTEAMLASWDRDLFNWLTPAKAYAFRGLGAIQASKVEVIQLNASGAQVSPSVLPDYSVTDNHDGTYAITFKSLPPSRMDLFVRATLPNSKTLMAPFQTNGQNVVNVISHYLVNQLLTNASTANQFDNLLPCAEEIGCTRQPESKLELWWGMASVVQNYEIDIASTSTIDQALSQLGNTADLNRHIMLSLDTILSTESPFVGATTRTVPKASDADYEDYVANFIKYERYNANMFGFSVNQAFDVNGTPFSVLATAAATQAGSDATQGGTGYTYPGLIMGIISSNRTLTSLSGDIPFLRTALTEAADGSRSILSPNEPNSFTTEATNTFLGVTGNYLTGKIPLQTITGKTSTQGTGWQYNPVVSNLFRKQETSPTQDAMFSAHFGTGNTYQLTKEGTNTWRRNFKSEAQNIFTFASYLPSAADDAPFSLAAIDGKKYGVIQFLLQLAPTGSVITHTAKIAQWSASGTTMTETQPTADYETKSYQRLENNSITSLSTSTGASTQYSIVLEENIETGKSGSDPDIIAQILYQRGRVSFNGNIGAIAPNGSQLAVTVNQASIGQGLIHGLELRTVAPDFIAGTVYDLQGHSFGVTTDSNSAISYAGSSLQFLNNTQAELVLTQIETAQNTTTHQVTSAKQLSEQVTQGTYTVDANGLIKFTFNNGLLLQGFVSTAQSDAPSTTPGNQMMLLLQQGDRLGLIYAGKRQSLSAN
ncbi:MAG: hypothetical protein H6999_04835 [Hahellaceae bacterium]|nr:hypothetical protein [Hahellaceae bacterium]